MNILMIDTSGPACGVAISRDGQIVCEMQLTSGKTHSQRVMPMVDQALALCEMTVTDVDLFGAVVGPGSFTGVRIGVSTVKALAHAAGKPCIGIDALEALAANAPYFDGVICPILDARAQQVYGAMFEGGMPPRRLMDDEAETRCLWATVWRRCGTQSRRGWATRRTLRRRSMWAFAQRAPARWRRRTLRTKVTSRIA